MGQSFCQKQQERAIEQELITAEGVPDQDHGQAIVTLRSSRRLTAVMLADVVGYSRRMSVDEDGTGERVAGLVTDVIDAALADHSGRLVKRMGDGVLAEFGSALDAVQCGIDIQRQLRQQQHGVHDTIQLRIGINTGDVVVSERDIYGHVINVAARLEGLAQPGSICVSQSIYDQTRGQPGLRFVDRGLQRLRNIDEPIRVFDVSQGQAAKRRRWRVPGRVMLRCGLTAAAFVVAGAAYVGRPQPSLRANSILVLPFRNLSGSADDEYFADAITDDVTTDLSRLSQAFVIASATALTYKGRALDARTIGKDCAVRYLLDGTIKRNAHTIQVNVQLIDASTGRNMWAERFAFETDNLVKLEEAITGRIGASLNIVEADYRPSLEGNSFATNQQSLDERFRAMAVIPGPPTPEKYLQARHDVEGCLRLDPNSSKCWSVLARIIMTEFLNSWNGVGATEIGRAEFAYRRALELDPSEAGAYYAAGLIFRVRGEHQRSIAEFDRALELDRSMGVVHAQKANALVFLGRIKEAIAEGEKAVSIDPLDPSIGVFYWVIGRAYFTDGNYKEAADWLARSVEQRPNLWYSRAWLISARALAHDHADSRVMVDEFQRHFPQYTLDRLREIYTHEEQYKNPTIAAAGQHLFQGLANAGLR